MVVKCQIFFSKGEKATFCSITEVGHGLREGRISFWMSLSTALIFLGRKSTATRRSVFIYQNTLPQVHEGNYLFTKRKLFQLFKKYLFKKENSLYVCGHGQMCNKLNPHLTKMELSGENKQTINFTFLCLFTFTLSLVFHVGKLKPGLNAWLQPN